MENTAKQAHKTASKTYFINTYGCQMNVHESEKIAGILEENGYQPADNQESAGLLIYNSCCVRETAETKIYGHLGKAKKMKETNPSLKIILCGCMAQKPGETEKLKKRLPFVDLIVGTHNLDKLGEYLSHLQSRGQHLEIWEKEGGFCTSPVKRKDKISAFITIMQGCNNFCSYCIVPYVRGRERSRPPEIILQEAEQLLQNGYKEITLLGQNVNSYGKDSSDKKDFAYLLRRLDALKNPFGKFKIKFMTSHPKDLSEEVIKTIADSENLAKFIHLPVQAGSNRILGLMNRTYTREDYLRLIRLVKSYMPDAGISSDLMVGFPTETEDEFLQSLDLIEQVRFNNLYTFIYNRRSGTKADQMDGQIPESTKTERIERIIKCQFEIGKEDAQNCVGHIFEILCERFEGGKGYGKTWEDRAVSFSAKGSCENYTGQFVRVKITSAKNTKLCGEIVY